MLHLETSATGQLMSLSLSLYLQLKKAEVAQVLCESGVCKYAVGKKHLAEPSS